MGEEKLASSWHVSNPPFRVLGITSNGSSLWAFPSDPKFMPKWAATDTGVCSVGVTLRCVTLESVAKPDAGADPVPAVVAPPSGQ